MQLSESSPSNLSHSSRSREKKSSDTSSKFSSSTRSTHRRGSGKIASGNFHQQQSDQKPLTPVSLPVYQPSGNTPNSQVKPDQPKTAYNQANNGLQQPQDLSNMRQNFGIDPSAREQLQRGLQHIQECSDVTLRAINRHPEMDSLKSFNETVVSLDQAVSETLQAAVRISRQSLEIARSHQEFKDRQREMFNQQRPQQPQFQQTPGADVNVGDIDQQQQWVSRLGELLAGLYEHLSSPPLGVQLRTAADLLTDLRTFVHDEPRVRQTYGVQQLDQQLPGNPGWGQPLSPPPNSLPSYGSPASFSPDFNAPMQGADPQVVSPLMSPTQWSEQMEQLYSGMTETYAAAGDQPAMQQLYNDQLQKGSQQLNQLRMDTSYRRVGGGY